MNRLWWLGALLALLTFVGLSYFLSRWDGYSTTAQVMPAAFDTMGRIGEALVSPEAYLLPFEVASVLLLAALVGAVYVAYTRR